MDPRLTRLRALFAADIAAMKAGTYTAPLPHRNMVERYEPSPKRVAAGKKRGK